MSNCRRFNRWHIFGAINQTFYVINSVVFFIEISYYPDPGPLNLTYDFIDQQFLVLEVFVSLVTLIFNITFILAIVYENGAFGISIIIGAIMHFILQVIIFALCDWRQINLRRVEFGILLVKMPYHIFEVIACLFLLMYWKKQKEQKELSRFDRRVPSRNVKWEVQKKKGFYRQLAKKKSKTKASPVAHNGPTTERPPTSTASRRSDRAGDSY